MATMRAVTVGAGALTLGQMICASPATVPPFTLIAPNATATNRWLRQVSGGAPSWEVIAVGDLPAHTHVVADVIAAAGQRLFGRSSLGSGSGQEISILGGIDWGSGSIQRSALTGDVTALAGSNATTIANAAVTLAKMANLTGLRLIGRNSVFAGVPGEVTISEALAWLIGKGEIAVGNAAGVPVALPAGTTRHVLTSTGLLKPPAWQSVSSALIDLGATRGMVLRRGAAGWEALALGASGQVLSSDGTDAVWGAASGGGGGLHAFRDESAGGAGQRYYPSSAEAVAGAPNTAAPAVNVLSAMPFVCPGGRTYTRIRLDVSVGGAAGSVARVGVYEAVSTTNLYPGALVLDSGTIDTTTAGVKTVTISFAAAPNTLYWLAYLCGVAAPTIYYMTSEYVSPVPLGVPTTLGATGAARLYVAQAYGALPATFTAGASEVNHALRVMLGIV